jgi:hypothetical protein
MALTTIMLLSGCSEEKNPIISKKSTAYITGSVFAYYCGIGDIINNIPVDPRYTTQTGYEVPVSFIKPDDSYYHATTDDSSEFSLTVDTGMYTITLQLAHNYPDTIYNVHINKDTTMELILKYDFYFSDTIVISFQTDNKPASIIAEMEDMVLLDSLIENMILPDSARRDTVLDPIRGLVAHYYVPLNSNILLWEVLENILLTYSAFSDSFNNDMWFNPGYYICP